MLLTVLIGIALIWMHVSIVRMDRKSSPELRGPRYLPELEALMSENKKGESAPHQIKQET